MKEYKRLTKEKGFHKDIDLTQELGYSYIYQRLAELEDKIEQGKMLELPCKVGDTVYCIYDNEMCDYWIEEELVHDFILTNDGDIDIGTECRMIGKFNRYDVFLTKAEAEAKLKELQEKYDD